MELMAVIMAGGAGTRFWPLSTEARPKQFLSLLGERTLLQESYDRLAGLVPPERVLVLTADRFVDLVREQLPMLPAANIVGEPLRRDTAAAVALAALLCRQRFGAGVMAVLTSDHRITPVEQFQRDLVSAAAGVEAQPGALYTFGIRPSYAATGYGYLERGERTGVIDDVEHFRLERFREKPDAETARSYLQSGRYFWNSGMFVWTLEGIIAELERQLPHHVEQIGAAVAADGTPAFAAALRRSFEPLEKTSIDYGVMERAGDVRCVAASFDWSDVGGWLALETFLRRDDAGNAFRGNLHLLDARRNLVFCDAADEHVALIGVEGLVVVRSGDRTLIVPRERAEDIKRLVARLDAQLR